MPLSREEKMECIPELPSGDAQERAATSAETSSAWTPGPWRSVQAKTLTDGARDFAIVAGDKRIVAEVFGRCAEADYPPAAANARLISAAPDGYAAAKDALAGWRYIREHHGDLYGVGWDRVETALADFIAKADGQS